MGRKSIKEQFYDKFNELILKYWALILLLANVFNIDGFCKSNNWNFQYYYFWFCRFYLIQLNLNAEQKGGWERAFFTFFLCVWIYIFLYLTLHLFLHVKRHRPLPQVLNKYPIFWRYVGLYIHILYLLCFFLNCEFAKRKFCHVTVLQFFCTNNSPFRLSLNFSSFKKFNCS